MAIVQPNQPNGGEIRALRSAHKTELDALEKAHKDAIRGFKTELERATEPTASDVAIVTVPQLVTAAIDGIIDAKLIAPRMASKQPTGAPVASATIGLFGTIGGMVLGHRGTVLACASMLGSAGGAIARGTLAGLLAPAT